MIISQKSKVSIKTQIKDIPLFYICFIPVIVNQHRNKDWSRIILLLFYQNRQNSQDAKECQ